MFAGSAKMPAGVGNVPLFARETPHVATVAAGVRRAVNQYELVSLDGNTGGVGGLNGVGYMVQETLLGSGKLGVTAYAAAAGETVQVYVAGTFNVAALNLENVNLGTTPENMQDLKRILQGKTANSQSAVYFDLCETDKTQSN